MDDDELRRRRLFEGTVSSWNPAEDAGNLTFEKLQQAKADLEAVAGGAETLIAAILVCERLPISRPLLVDDPADGNKYYILKRADFETFLNQIPEEQELKPGDQLFHHYPTLPETRRIVPLGIRVVENADEFARELFRRLAAKMAAGRYNYDIRY